MNSMTGFGAATAPLGGSTIRVEISGVNRKQAEIAIALPRAWAALETPVRDIVATGISRGRVNVSLTLQQVPGSAGALTLNRDKLAALTATLAEAETSLGRSIDTSLDSLLRLGIIAEETETEIPLETVQAAAEPAVREALAAFIALRGQEGENMKRDLLVRIATLRQFREKLMARASGVAARHREILLKRLAEAGLPLPLDDERIIKEIALFADKCDVSEEMTRLESHLNQFQSICDKPEPVGRTLDFLCQEIFRELNTTGSKANDAELAQLVVSAKTELEKIREQVQNIE